MSQNVSNQNGNGGIQYRRAKVWQIILVSCSGLVGMSFYFLMGLASYSANVGFGVASLAIGGVLTFTRILDAVTDPLLAFVYDKVNARFGKIRILLVSGWLIMNYSYGAVCGWLFGGVCGIRLKDGKITISPQPHKSLQYAKAVYNSPAGEIVSGWKYEGEKVTYEIEIPSNTEAEVILPDGRREVLTAGNYRL